MAILVQAFLSPAEVAELCALAATSVGWTSGRQGTGYHVLPIKQTFTGPAVARALAQLGSPFEDYWDVYLIRYVDGAYVPVHLDPAHHGKRHRRINALLGRAASGGALRIGGGAIELELGDAVVFYPDEEAHEVSPVTGTRLLFSVGAWLRVTAR